MSYLLFVIAAFAASLISGIFGFGTAMFVLAIGPHLIPVEQAIALAAVLFAASTITKTILFRKHMDWKIVGVMALSSMPFAYAGGVLLSYMDPLLTRRLLGLMILSYLALSYFKPPKLKLGLPGIAVGAASYGLLSGLLGTGSVIKVVMLRELNITREAFVGAMAATSVLASCAKIVAYSQSGLLTLDLWPTILGLCVAAISASFIGRRYLGKLSVTGFDIGVRVLLAIAAIALVI